MGTKVVIYSNANLESFYEQTLQYLHEKYHSHPTMLDYGPLCAEESARISYYDGMARENARHAIKSQRGRNQSYFDVNDMTIGEMYEAGICDKHGLT